jgi:hypothetical protein
MSPIINFYNDNKSIIKPFSEIIKQYKKEHYFNLNFVRSIKYPLDYNDLNSLIKSFVMFFPIYYSLLEIAQNKKCSFINNISKLNYKNIFEDYQNNEDAEIIKKVTTNFDIDETKFIRAGVRWQIFERDDFKCVACGKSAHDGAILHVDHIIPRSKGGKDKMENYQTLCHLCNIGKSNKSNKNLRKK